MTEPQILLIVCGGVVTYGKVHQKGQVRGVVEVMICQATKRKPKEGRPVPFLTQILCSEKRRDVRLIEWE